MNKVTVVKIGGSTLDNYAAVTGDIAQLQRQGKALVIVHGGGKRITEWLSERGVATRFWQGERITDTATLEVVIAVLGGLVNKQIVAAINSQGGRAVGLSGADGSLIRGKIKAPALGYTGAVVRVNPAPLEMLLQAGYIPVVTSISLNLQVESDETARLLNINADAVAGEIAATIVAERLILLTDVDGVRDRSGRLIPELSTSEVGALITSGVISGGMIPKVNACLRALTTIPMASIIDGRQPHALLGELENGGFGTTMRL
ncbi:MAG: acetylglutamate kinase [Dehalococcoidales bacterium]|nr:acetylglutamate kinase [Dehalococcoidales bacterium]